MKSVKMFGKSIPLLGILMIVLLASGVAYGAVVSFLSNKVTTKVAVESPIELSGTFTYQTIQYEAPTFTAPTIDGVIGSGEWDGAVSIPVANEMGTVRVLATTSYLYMLFDVVDPTDARIGQNIHGNDQVGLNINPTAGVPWGLPCKIIFQTGADPNAWTGVSSGTTDGWKTDWVINGVQQISLPDGLVTKTLYSATTRISEWQIPLATINPSLGDNLDLGGAIDVGDMSSYIYPTDLVWGNPGTYVHYTIGTSVTVTETFDGTKFSEQLYGGSTFSMSFSAKNLANNGIDTTIGIVMTCPSTWTPTTNTLPLPEEITNIMGPVQFYGYSADYFVVASDVGGIGPGQTAGPNFSVQLSPIAAPGTYTIRAVAVWTQDFQAAPAKADYIVSALH